MLITIKAHCYYGYAPFVSQGNAQVKIEDIKQDILSSIRRGIESMSVDHP